VDKEGLVNISLRVNPGIKHFRRLHDEEMGLAPYSLLEKSQVRPLLWLALAHLHLRRNGTINKELGAEGADLLAHNPADLRLNSWARPRPRAAVFWLRQWSSNMPDHSADCLRYAAQQARPRNRRRPFWLTDLSSNRLPDADRADVRDRNSGQNCGTTSRSILGRMKAVP